MGYLKVLFKKQKKNFPVFLRKIPGSDYLRLGIFIAISAWLFQGMRYMNWRETVLKLTLDLFLTLFGIFCGLSWYFAFLLAHTLNFLFNGQFFAMFTHMGANRIQPSFFLSETIHFSEFLKNCSFIETALAYGSLVRGEYKKTSDIDMRIVPKDGEYNFWKCAWCAVGLRCIAFIHGYPLDLYIFTFSELKYKMRCDETPLLLAGNKLKPSSIYPQIISLQEFRDFFAQKQLRKL